MDIKTQFIAASISVLVICGSANVDAATTTVNDATLSKSTSVTAAFSKLFSRLLSNNVSASSVTQKTQQTNISCDANDKSQRCDDASPRIMPAPPKDAPPQPCTGRQCPDILEPIEGDI